MAKLLLAALTLTAFVGGGCKAVTGERYWLTIDEQVEHLQKCRDAGFESEVITNINDEVIRINCVSNID